MKQTVIEARMEIACITIRLSEERLTEYQFNALWYRRLELQAMVRRPQ